MTWLSQLAFHHMIMNNFWIFRKACVYSNRTRSLACAGITTKKIFYDKNSSFPFSSQSRKLRFIEGRGLFSYFCSLLSFSLCFCPLIFHEHVKWNKFSSSLLYHSCQGVAYLWKCHVFVKLQMLMLRRIRDFCV